MNIKICKFGGTSISNDIRCQCALNIVKKMNQTHKVIVVISAIGRMGDPYATDTLAAMGNPRL